MSKTLPKVVDNLDTAQNKEEQIEQEKKKKCFVIMPISDQQGYEPGHFTTVYKELIRPAVISAGFECERADTANQTHNIILSILKSVVDSDMAICDLSALNPNVMYELGIRQMARKPVVLLKDQETRDIFDTGILKHIKYHNRLRVDEVRESIEEISSALKNTFENPDNKSNSLLDLLNVEVQVEKTSVKISSGEQLILERLERLEVRNTPLPSKTFLRSGSVIRQHALAVTISAFIFSRGDFIEYLEAPGDIYPQLLVFIAENGSEYVFINAQDLQKLTFDQNFVPYKIHFQKVTRDYFNSLPSHVQENLLKIEKMHGVQVLR